MSIAEGLLHEFQGQVPVTRRFLERLPEDRLGWKPHAKSMSAGQLALHLATIPGGVARGAQMDVVPPPKFQFADPGSVGQVLEAFEQSVATVMEVLPGFDDAKMKSPWRVMEGDKELLVLPREVFLRDILLNHWYQHRGQFSVYLRMMDVAVPASWGPSADEGVAFQTA